MKIIYKNIKPIDVIKILLNPLYSCKFLLLLLFLYIILKFNENKPIIIENKIDFVII